jgi:cation:H+ antiporter
VALQIALLIVGILFLWKGSDYAVDGGKRLAAAFGIGETIFGLTIVSVGTSLPEIFTNIYSAVRIRGGTETSGIAVGTVIGSEIGQITLVLGVAALVGTMRVELNALRRDGAVMILALGAMAAVGLDGRVTQLEGGLLCLAYVGYLWYLARSYSIGARVQREIREGAEERIKVAVELLRMGAGLAIVLVGGTLVVNNATELATDLGVSQTLVGILVVGVGTSLPELSIGITGIRRDAAGLSLGALLGSNITDPTLSLGSGALISGFEFDTDLLRFDVPYWLFATLVALLFLRTEQSIGVEDRREGCALVVLFVGYVALKLTVFS